MKLTAEYLESKGWKKKEVCFEIYAGVTHFVLFLSNENWNLFIKPHREGGYSIAMGNTQSRFDRLWSAITEQD